MAYVARHRHAGHWSRHLHARPANCVVTGWSAGCLHVLLATGESLGGHGLYGHRREQLRVALWLLQIDTGPVPEHNGCPPLFSLDSGLHSSLFANDPLTVSELR